MSGEILILTRLLPHHSLGGMQIVAWDLAREFARVGQAVRVITTSIPGKPETFTEDGVHVVALRGTPPERYSRAWWRASRAYVGKHCIGNTAAVLSVSAAGFGVLPLRTRMPGVRFVMQAHGTSIGEIVSKWRSRRLRAILGSVRNLAWLPRDMLAYSKFDTVVAVGGQVQRDLARAPICWFLDPNRVVQINNGIDTTLFHPDAVDRANMREILGIAAETPVILSASRLHAQKGLVHGLQAFSRLHQELPQALYLIAGDGPEREALEALVVSLGIADSVRFLGALKHEYLARILRTADVFVFLTDHIEVGITLNVMEALASGLPSVVSEHLQLPSCLGLHLVDRTSYQDVSNCLLKLLSIQAANEESGFLPPAYKRRHAVYDYLNTLYSCAQGEFLSMKEIIDAKDTKDSVAGH